MLQNLFAANPMNFNLEILLNKLSVKFEQFSQYENEPETTKGGKCGADLDIAYIV